MTLGPRFSKRAVADLLSARGEKVTRAEVDDAIRVLRERGQFDRRHDVPESFVELIGYTIRVESQRRRCGLCHVAQTGNETGAPDGVCDAHLRGAMQQRIEFTERDLEHFGDFVRPGLQISSRSYERSGAEGRGLDSFEPRVDAVSVWRRRARRPLPSLTKWD